MGKQVGKYQVRVNISLTSHNACAKRNKTKPQTNKNQNQEHAGNNENKWKVIYKIKNINRMSG